MCFINIFSQSEALSIFLPVPLKAENLILMKSNLSIFFSFTNHDFYVISKKSSSKVTKIFPYISFISLKDLGFIFKSITQFELIFTY